ncbi:MAG: zinc transporter ZntB [Gammaproteobacteria bacterium]|jgi:zinc transporter|nr:zinc transporter ZntB [Gammaproteobacteria bacterium]
MQESGLISSYLLDGQGGGESFDWDRIAAWQPDHGVLWVHLDRDSPDSRRWLQDQSGLDPLVAESLIAESTRPRCVQVGGGVMLFLRGVNLNPGADPEDMVSIRLWIEEGRIISLRLRRLLSIADLRASIDQGCGPSDVGDFVVQLADRLVSRISGVISDVDDRVDDLQDQVLEAESGMLRTELTRLRREIISLRRYLAPQRDALARLTQLKLPWLNDMDQMHLREEADRVVRYVEDLDSARERAAVTQEELVNRVSEQINSRMYVLSVVAAIFLPLGFLTGLFGINVGGIPLAENPSGFVDVILILVLITALQVILFRWRRWL